MQTSLQRAKAFLASKATKLAMTAVPLAILAVAVPASGAQIGNVVFNPASCSATGSGSNTPTGSCTTAEAATKGGNTQANWMALWGSLSGPNFNAANFLAAGTASGIFEGGSLPFSWDFTVSSVAPSGGSVNWLVETSVKVEGSTFSSSRSGSFQLGTSESRTERITGLGMINNIGPGRVTDWSMSLNVTATGLEIYMNNITIPAGTTLDLNPGSTAVPEPASVGGVAIGIGGLWIGLRRKKKS